MWIYNNEIIKTPKAMKINGLTYSSQIFKDSALLAELGIATYEETSVNERYYWRGELTIDENNVGTYTVTPKDVDDLKADMKAQVKNAVSGRLTPTDWMIIRASEEGGEAVPANVLTYRAAIRSEGNTKETEIDALETINDVIEYEAAGYTEVRKVAVEIDNGDGTSTSTYSDTETVENQRKINKVTHFTATDPLADADEGLVSLTENS